MRASSGPDVSEQLSPLSQTYLANRPKAERSGLGQFLTPKALRDRLLDHVPLRSGDRVLDPGVGTGEFLRSCADRVAGLALHGWDIDPAALAVARELVPEAELQETSALEAAPTESFDVVIGNPPYFEVRGLDAALRDRYKRVLAGRPNIFSMFFQVGLDQLKPGGHLGYVVPPSMNNGAFFAALRSYIAATSSIEFLEVYTNKFLFEDVQTAVQLIVLRKGGEAKDFTIDLGTVARSAEHRLLFSQSPDAVADLYRGTTTLHHLGYEAVTGTLVWNQHKDALLPRREPGSVPLLWAHNITDADEVVLVEDHPKKLQYVTGAKALTGPAIIVNRITGSVGGGSLRCAFVPSDFSFVGENHVNVIRRRRGVEPRIDWSELLAVLRQDGINERVRMLTGNTQLSARELTHWLPLDVPGVEPVEPPRTLF